LFLVDRKAGGSRDAIVATRNASQGEVGRGKPNFVLPQDAASDSRAIREANINNRGGDRSDGQVIGAPPSRAGISDTGRINPEPLQRKNASDLIYGMKDVERRL